MTQVQPKHTELIDRLNDLELNTELQRENPFAWKSSLNAIRREALALLSGDVVYASIVLGMAACLQGDYKEMISRHTNAINNAPNHFLANYNYAQSLCRFGLHNEAIPYYKKALRIDPQALGVYEASILNSLLGGRWDLAAATFDIFKKLVTDEKKENLGEKVKLYNNFLLHNEIPAEALAAMNATAVGLLHSKGLFPEFNSSTSIKHFPGPEESIRLNIGVNTDRETIKSLNNELSDILAASFEEIYADKIVLAYAGVA